MKQNELFLKGEKHISSKRAAQETGYTNDYIGQLCRSGKIESQMVGRDRFVDKNSLQIYLDNLDKNKNPNLNSREPFSGRTADFSSPINKVSNLNYLVFSKKILTPILVILVIAGIYNFNETSFVRAGYDFVFETKGKILVTGENFATSVFDETNQNISRVQRGVSGIKISFNNLNNIKSEKYFRFVNFAENTKISILDNLNITKNTTKKIAIEFSNNLEIFAGTNLANLKEAQTNFSGGVNSLTKTSKNKTENFAIGFYKTTSGLFGKTNQIFVKNSFESLRSMLVFQRKHNLTNPDNFDVARNSFDQNSNIDSNKNSVDYIPVNYDLVTVEEKSPNLKEDDNKILLVIKSYTDNLISETKNKLSGSFNFISDIKSKEVFSDILVWTKNTTDDTIHNFALAINEVENISKDKFFDVTNSISFRSKDVTHNLALAVNEIENISRSKTENFAIGFYETIFSLFSRRKDTTLVVEKEAEIGGLSEEEPKEVVRKSTQSITQPITQTTIINPIKERIIETVVERVVSGVTLTDLEKINNELRSEIYRVADNANTHSNNNYQAIALTNKIDNLSSVTINNSTITGGTITGSVISGTTGLFSGSFSGIGGSFSGDLSVGGQFTVSGAATSTMAGDFAFDTNTLYIDSINHRVGIGTTSPDYELDINGDVRATGVVISAGGGGGGNFSVAGDTTLGTATSSNFTYFNSRIGTSLIPSIDNGLDLGNGTDWLRWRTGYFGTSVGIGGTATSTGNSLTSSGAYTIDSNGLLSINTTNNQSVIFGSGLITLPNFNSTNSTTTNATTTNLYASSLRSDASISTNASTTLLSVSGQSWFNGSLNSTALATFSNSSTTLATITDLWSTDIRPTNIYDFTLQGAITGNSQNITGLGNLTGSTYTFTNATTTNATSTNLYISNWMNLASGKDYRINGTSVLDSTTLGAGVINSSLTSVGILNSGSITSNFGSIDTGASNITTTGTGNFGTVNITGLSTFANATSTLTTLGNLFISGNTIEATNDNGLALYDNASNGIFIEDGGNVGIGNTSPLGKVHIKTGDSGGSIDSTADELVVEGSVDTGITIINPSTNIGALYFASELGKMPGGIEYNHVDSSMTVRTNGSDQIIIDSAGRMNIRQGKSGALVSTNADDLFIESNNDGGLTIGTPNTNLARLFFSDPEANNSGKITYNHNTDFMTIGADSNDVIFLDGPSKLLGVGISSPLYELHVGNDIAFSGGGIEFPAGISKGGDSILGIGATSILNIALQDGSGRSNFYWNAFWDNVDLEHQSIVGGGEKAVNLEIGNGYFGVMVDQIGSTNPGDAIEWTRGYRLESNGTTFLKFGYENEDVYLNRVNGANADIFAFVHSDTSANSINYTSRRSRGTDSLPTALIAGYDIAKQNFDGYDGSSFVTSSQIVAEADADFSVGDTTGRLILKAKDDTSTLLEFLRISGNNKNVVINDGNMDIDFRVEGDTNPNLFKTDALNDRVAINDNTPDYKFEILGTSGNGYFGVTNLIDGDIFEIDDSGNVGISNTSPSYKLDVTGFINTDQYSGYKQAGNTILYASSTNQSLLAGIGAGNSLLSDGLQNTALGYQALYTATSTDYNTAVGYQAGFSNTTGDSNSFLGQNSGLSNTTGSFNSFMGRRAGLNNTTGSSNSFIGASAGRNNTTGSNNSFIGTSAGLSNITGYSNSFMGTYAGYSNTTGFSNSFMGSGSGRYITDGSTPNETASFSVFLGQDTKALADGQTNQIVIGYDATGIGSNSVVLGNDSILTTALRGNVGIGTTSPFAKLSVAGDIYADGNLTVSGLTATSSISATSFNSTDTANGGYSIGGSKILYASSTNQSLLAGIGAGNSLLSDGLQNTALGYQALYTATSTDNNTAVGYQAGYLNTTGSSNSFLGQGSGYSNTTGGSNSFLGQSSGRYNTTGSSNSFLGQGSGFSNTTGGSNSFLGQSSGRYNTTGNYNSFLGQNSGYSNTTGSSNSFLGQSSGRYNTTGSSNSFLGRSSGHNNTTGNYNSFLGQSSGFSNTTGSSNSFLGQNSGFSNTTGGSNSFLGQGSGFSNTTGSSNTFIGYGSGRYITDGSTLNETASNSVFLGRDTKALADGQTNQIVIGYDATGIGSNSVVLGNDSILTTALRGNVGIGTTSPFAKLSVAGDIYADGNLTVSGLTATSSISATSFNSTDTANGGYSIGGSKILYASSTNQSLLAGIGAGNSLLSDGLYNTALGYQALYTATSTDNNTAVGYYSLRSNTIGDSNSAFGRYSLRYNTTGDYNTALGGNSLSFNTTGSYNLALGRDSLYFNKSASSTVAIGYRAGYGVLDQSYNQNGVLLGYKAGHGLTTGDNNLLLGYKSGDNLTTGDTNIVIGYNIDSPTATNSNTMTIGNLIYGTGIDGIGTTLSSGNVGIGTTNPGSKLDIHGGIGATSLRIGNNSGTGDVMLDFYGTNGAAVPVYANITMKVIGGTVGSESGQLAFSTINSGTLTEKMRILDSGNVGIGTTSPFAKLSVENTDSGHSLLIGDEANDASPFVIDTSGNVGIGTATPGSKLDVAGNLSVGIDGSTPGKITFFNDTSESNDPYIAASNKSGGVGNDLEIKTTSTSGSIYLDSAGVISFQTNGADKMTLLENGNIGIGNISPTYKLDVSGFINTDQYSGYKQAGNTILYASSTNSSLAAGIGAGISLLPDGLYNTALGYQALTTTTSSDGNTAVGYGSGYSNTTGYNNTFSGVSSGYSNTIGYSNTFSGANSGYSNTTGNTNIFLGASSGYFNTTGNYNTFLGRDSGLFNTTGSNNTFSGVSSGRYNASATSTTAIGYKAGYGVSGQSYNQNGVILGYQAGYGLTTGDNNLLLGYQAGDNLTTGDTNIVIGYNIDSPTATNSNTMTIGNLIYGTGIDGTGTTLSSGNVGIGTVSPTQFKLQVAGNVGPDVSNTYNLGSAGYNWGCLYYNGGTLGTCASDERLKENITDLTFGDNSAEKLAGLRLRTFNYISGGDPYDGLIAQETQLIAPELVATSTDGFLKIKYGKIQWLVISAVQQMWEKITELSSKVAELFEWKYEADSQLLTLEKRITALESQLAILGVATPQDSGADVSLVDPTIIINGNNPANIDIGSSYVDLGVIAQDSDKNDLSVFASLMKDGISIDNSTTTVDKISLDTSTSTTYIITYTAKDNNDTTVSIERSVIVGDGGLDLSVENVVTTPEVVATTTPEIIIDEVSPTITLNGEGNVEIILDSSYVDLGVTANDDIDGDITGDVVVGGEVDTTIIGTYVITYNVSDSSGNQAVEVVRSIDVAEPVIENIASSTPEVI